MNQIKPVHPGEILLEEFMKPLKISQNRLARDIHVPVPRIHAIVNNRRSITADTALRLAKYFKTTPQFWLNIQTRYELEVQQDILGKCLDSEIQPCSAMVQSSAEQH